MLSEPRHAAEGAEPEGKPPRFLLEWGGRGSRPGEFDFPIGIALDREGNLVITHFSAMKLKETRKPDCVSVSTRDGTLVRQWGRTGTGDGSAHEATHRIAT